MELGCLSALSFGKVGSEKVCHPNLGSYEGKGSAM